MEHHHHVHHTPPLHWGYSATPPHHNTWVPPQTRSGGSHKRTISESDCEDLFSETSSSKDQTSPKDSDSCQHQSRKKRRGVIEKKRRDRINVSLIELKRLVPSAFEKQGSAKLEKAEILQLTVDHLKMLHAKGFAAIAYDPHRFAADYNNIGYRECVAEVARYLSNVEGMDAQEPMRMRLLEHLQCNVTQREQVAASAAAAASVQPPSTGSWPAPPPPPVPGNATAAGAYASSAALPPTQHQHHHIGHHHQHAAAASSSAYHPTAGYQHQHQHQQQQQQQHQQYSTAAIAGSSTSSGSSGGYVPNLSPSLAAQTAGQQQQHNTVSHTSTSATGATSTTASTTNTSVSTSRSEHLSGEENQGQQQHQQHQHQQLQQQQHHQQHLHHHYPPLVGGDGHPIAPTYIDISQSHLRHAATADAVSGYVHYGAPGSAATAGGSPAYANHPAYAGSKPYRPWGAEMAY